MSDQSTRPPRTLPVNRSHQLVRAIRKLVDEHGGGNQFYLSEILAAGGPRPMESGRIGRSDAALDALNATLSHDAPALDVFYVARSASEPAFFVVTNVEALVGPRA